MYCKRCFAELPEPPEDPTLARGPWLGGQPGEIPYVSPKRKGDRCWRCFRKFHPDDPKTYLTTLALTPWQIVLRIGLTTLLGIGAAYVVAFHQLAQASGH